MRPSFPTKTFPNHWTLVTGLVPDNHGIIANRMEDADRPDEAFTMATVDPYWWSEAKPIWVEAEEAGIRSAAMFRPGSAVARAAPRSATARSPTARCRATGRHSACRYQHAAGELGAQWSVVRRTSGRIRLYFDTVDSAGHGGGPKAR